MFKGITNTDEIQDALIEIQSFVEEEYNAEDINAIVNRATKLEGYMALSGKLLADSKWHYSATFEEGFVEAMRHTSKYSASTTNLYLKSLCKNFQYLVDWADRINATCTHQLEFSRTLISKIKAEMYNRL